MRFLISLLFLVLLTGFAHATIYEVPTQFETIQSAIDASEENDTVLVHQGSYNEALTIANHPIMLTSIHVFSGDSSDISETIIDGSGIGENSLNLTAQGISTIHGITFDHGMMQGIYIGYSEAVLSFLIISNSGNSGVSSSHSNVSVQNCRIVNNEASWGGGVFAAGPGLLTIRNSIISNNFAESGAGGRFIDTSVEIYNSMITANYASFEGGAIQSELLEYIKLDKVLIAGNSALREGGFYLSSENVQIIGCTICDNYSDMISLNFHRGTTQIANSILWENEYHSLPDTLCIFFSNVQGGYEGEGNIDSNPLFLNPDSGDYRLSDSSPCIDTGTNLFIIDGDTILYIPDDSYEGTAPDMGALEFTELSIRDLDLKSAPYSYILVNAYPNPFNSTLNIRVNLPIAGDLKVKAIDLLGHEVASFSRGAFATGWQTLSINADTWPSGTYWIVLNNSYQQVIKQVILLK